MKQFDFKEMPLGLVGRDTEMLSLLREVLTGAGFQVRARLADGFLTTLENQEVPALLIYDEAYPDVDAERILSLLQEYPKWRALPVVVLSDQADGVRIARCLDRGVQEFIAKPFSAEELAARIRKLLRQRQAMEAQSQPKSTSFDGFAGDLAYMNIPDLLMLVSQNVGSGEVVLTMENGEYRCTFIRGRLAGIQGPDGLKGRKALFRAVRLFYGRFVFHPIHDPPAPGGSMQDYGDIPSLVLQAVQESDEYVLMRNQLPPDPMMVRMADEAKDLSTVDLRVIRPLLREGSDGEETIDQLVQLYPKSDCEAVKALLKLYQDGVIVPA